MKGLLVGGAIVSGLKEVAEKIWDVAKAGAAYADDILTMSTVTGLSTDALQEYQYMADLVDVSVETITGSITKLHTATCCQAKDGTASRRRPSRARHSDHHADGARCAMRRR